MDTLRQQVAIAYRRLVIQRFLTVLAWSWFATLLVAAAAIGVSKAYPLGVDSFVWTMSWIVGAFFVGLIIAGFWTYATRQSRLEAAIEIDRRFGLKERVSSTLALDADDLQSDAGRALARDAVRRVERLDVPSQFGLQFHKRSLLPLIPAALAVGLLFF